MKRILLLFALLLPLALSQSARAQPDTGGPQPTNPAATGVPLDGGASLLLASGVAYGLRRLRRAKA